MRMSSVLFVHPFVRLVDCDHIHWDSWKRRQPLRHIRHWISRKPWGLVPKDHQWEMAYGESQGRVTWPMASRDPERSNSWPQKAYSWKTAGDAT